MSNAKIKVTIVIVTFNSEAVIFKCLDAIKAHGGGDFYLDVVLVDSGSSDSAYVKRLFGYLENLIVFPLESNVGFCRANNIGFSKIEFSDYVVFLNPDAFLTENLLPEMVVRMSSPSFASAVAASPLLMGYSINSNAPSGHIDSLGIDYTWFGKHFDRGMGAPTNALSDELIRPYLSHSPILCGAFMFCRFDALKKVSINGSVFDEKFYMYKEDIELSMRLSRNAGQVVVFDDLNAYHCRGWSKDRSRMPTWSIRLSLFNEWRILIRYFDVLGLHSFFRLVYLIFKSIYVGVEVVRRYFVGR